MGKIIATYLIKLTLRALDETDVPPRGPLYPADEADVPTLEELSYAVEAAAARTGVEANATAERTDR